MAIASTVVLYILPGLLGRAYDLKNATVGPDLFTRESTAQAKTIDRYMTTSEYKIVSDFSEATNFLDIDGQLQLKLKLGSTDIEGSAKGSYLSETKSFENRVDILIKVLYETVIETIPPSSIEPMSDWEDKIKGQEFTHFIRSIQYGGELVASVQFRTSNKQDKEVIKGILEGSLNAGSGSFGLDVNAKLDKIKETVTQSAMMDINYYATVPIEGIPRSIEGLSELVQKFPEQAKKLNHGKGVPFRMEVLSLAALDKAQEIYYRTATFDDQLRMLNEELTDIRNAKRALSDWFQTVPPVLPKKENDKIGLFATKLEKLNVIFSQTTANMDLSPNGTQEQFNAALDAYKGDHPYITTNMYVKELSKLKKEVLDGTPTFETDFGGAYYNYWGATDCPKETDLLFTGVMSATDENSQGSSQYMCLPANHDYTQDSGKGEEIEDYSQLEPVAFISKKATEDTKRVLVNCSSCRVPGKSTTTMLSGKSTCPDKWVAQYHGILVSTNNKLVRGQFACLDTSKTFPNAPEELTQLTEITEVRPQCGSFPCTDTVKQTTSIQCVVCSITKEGHKPSSFLL